MYVAFNTFIRVAVLILKPSATKSTRLVVLSAAVVSRVTDDVIGFERPYARYVDARPLFEIMYQSPTALVHLIITNRGVNPVHTKYPLA